MQKKVRETIKEIVERADPSLSPAEKSYAEEALAKLSQTGIPQQAFDISDNLMEMTYKRACILFKAGKYEEAVKIFESLCYLNPIEARYPLAAAASYHYLKDYSKAATNYLKSKDLDSLNPIPCFHLYDCFLKLNQPLLAFQTLIEVVIKCQDIPMYQSLKEKALLEQEYIKPHLEKWFNEHDKKLSKMQEAKK